MAYTPTPEDRQKIRYELNDNSPGLYILDDSTIDYYLTKNSGSISATSIDCCRAILLRLSMDSSDNITDVLSIKSSKAAEQYRLSLQMYLNNPSLNPLIKSASIYAGNVSLPDMNTNDTTADNNYVSSASVKNVSFMVDPCANPFGV